jgi:hypothetical protein
LIAEYYFGGSLPFFEELFVEGSAIRLNTVGSGRARFSTHFDATYGRDGAGKYRRLAVWKKKPLSFSQDRLSWNCPFLSQDAWWSQARYGGDLSLLDTILGRTHAPK